MGGRHVRVGTVAATVMAVLLGLRNIFRHLSGCRKFGTCPYVAIYLEQPVSLRSFTPLTPPSMSASAHTKTPRMTASEQSLVRRMHFEQGKSRSEIAGLLQRALSSVSRLLAQKKSPMPIGRPRALTEANIDRIVATVESLVDGADGDLEVTLAMVMRRCRLKVSPRTVSNALHSRGYRFRNMRQKPILTPSDIAERYAWACRYRSKPVEWWLRTVHAHLDNHAFKLATTSQGRKLLAKRVVRGVYRKKGKSLRPGHVKPCSKLHLGLGGRGVLKVGGVGGGPAVRGR